MDAILKRQIDNIIAGKEQLPEGIKAYMLAMDFVKTIPVKDRKQMATAYGEPNQHYLDYRLTKLMENPGAPALNLEADEDTMHETVKASYKAEIRKRALGR